MKTYLPLLASAISSVSSHVTARQAELDSAVIATRAAALSRLREMAVEDVSEEDPRRPLCDLLAASIEVGREDGYPNVKVPDEVKQVLLSGKAAGLISDKVGSLHFHADFSGLAFTPDALSVASSAWLAATNFRVRTTEK